MILLVSAVQEELGDLDGLPLGIGAIPAAATMARRLVEQRPEGVLLIGTGGSYADGPKVATAVAAGRVGLSPGVAAMGLGYVPQAPPPVLCDQRIISRLGLKLCDVLTVGAITTDPVLAGRLGDGWQVEHHEAFGVAWACAQASVPFAAVIGITNIVGPDAHAQWLTHRDEARRAVLLAIRPLFPSPSTSG